MEAVQEAYSEDNDHLSGDGSSSDEEEMQVEKQVSDLEATVSKLTYTHYAVMITIDQVLSSVL